MLQAMAHSRTFPAHTMLWDRGQCGEGIYVLLQGTVKVAVRRHRTEVILDILGAGQVLGEISTVDEAGHSASVMTLETCRLIWMEAADFAACRYTIPSLNHNLVAILTQRLSRISARLEALATLDSYGRVAYQLLAFAQEYGQAAPSADILLPLHLTQSDLASLIGISRERVKRVLSLYKRQGCISVGADNHLTIHDCHALSQRCGVSPLLCNGAAVKSLATTNCSSDADSSSF